MTVDADRPFKRPSGAPPGSMPERMKSETNPVKRFEGRRKWGIVGLLSLVMLGCLFGARGLLNPFGGMDQLVASAPTGTKIPTKVAYSTTPTAVIMQLQPIVTPTRRSAPVGVAGLSVTCWANADSKLSDGSLIPKGAMVRVTGSTQAYGGLLEIDSAWLPMARFNCEASVEDLEKPYVVPPAVKSSARSNVISASADPFGYSVVAGDSLSVAQPPRVITSSPLPTYTPYPTVAPLNGVWRDLDCWNVQLNGVTEIWVNGQGVSNGRYCGVNEIKIVVNKWLPPGTK